MHEILIATISIEGSRYSVSVKYINQESQFMPESMDHLSNTSNNPWEQASLWYQSELGQVLLELELKHINTLLETLFGYNLVQLGCISQCSLMDSARIRNRYVFDSSAGMKHKACYGDVLSSFNNLPLQNDSIDVILLPHTLEFEPHPHQILREVERVLVPEGKALILGFNPVSLWGIWQHYRELKYRVSRRNTPPLPSCGNLKSQRRITDWLQLLGFDVDLAASFCYRPPVSNPHILKRLAFMEKAGNRSWPFFAGVYLLQATKRISTLTPVIESWNIGKKLINPDVIEPAS